MPNFKLWMFIFRKQLLNVFYLKNQSVIIRIVTCLSFFLCSYTSHFYSVKVTCSLTAQIRNEIIQFIQFYSRWKYFPRIINSCTLIKILTDIVFLNKTNQYILTNIYLG